MTEASTKSGSVWPVVLARFEQHAPASVMARTALEHALSPDWIDAVFEAERQRQYSRELMFSTVVDGGANPRKYGDGQKVGTEFAVKPP